MRIYIIAAVAAMLVSTVSARAKGGIGNAEVSKKNGKNRLCKDPDNAVLAAMTCIEAGDAGCSAAAYAPGFKKMHNEIELTLVLDEETWEVIFLFFDLKLETRYIATIGENQVSYRDIESVGNYFRRCQFGTYTISYLSLLSNVHSTRTRPRNFGRRLQDSYLGPIRRHSGTERC